MLRCPATIPLLLATLRESRGKGKDLRCNTPCLQADKFNNIMVLILSLPICIVLIGL